MAFRHKTLAIVARAPNLPPSLEKICLDGLRPDEAIVEIHAVGVCHLEIAILHGHIPQPFPRVLGHEGSGIVKEVGSEVTHVRPGDKVILSIDTCGQCPNCKEHLPSYCAEGRSRNWDGFRPDKTTTLKSVDGQPIHGNFLGQSSFSRLALVSRNSIIKVAPDTNLSVLAPLGCGVQTGSGAVLNVLNVQKGESLVVSGCGAVGMSAIMAAKIRGASPIVAIDLAEDRLILAKELGATHTLNGKEQPNELIEQIRQLAPLPAGIKHAFDTTGVPKVIETLIEATGVRGTTVVVGATPFDKTISIQPLKFLDMGKRFIGSVEGDSDPAVALPYLIDQFSKGNLPLEKIVKQYRYTDFAQAIKDMESGKTIKPILIWDDEETT